jgi:hypothetical protein
LGMTQKHILFFMVFFFFVFFFPYVWEHEDVNVRRRTKGQK